MNIPSQKTAQIRFINIYNDSVTRAAVRVPFDNLDNGTRVLSDESECIRYLALYGGHHFHKLYAAYGSTKFENIEGRNIEIFDWGCGQALATCVLIDYLIEKNANLNVSSITLIEPSKVALERGQCLIRQMFQNDNSTDSVVRLVNKYIDDVGSTDLVSNPDSIKIHLFSNILDVEGFDLSQLYRSIASSFQGVNRFICTSPDYERQQRLEAFYDFFLQAHQVAYSSSSSEPIYGEVFYAATGRYEKRRIGRCERQFTVNLARRGENNSYET
jgi:hypothetical protein